MLHCAQVKLSTAVTKSRLHAKAGEADMKDSLGEKGDEKIGHTTVLNKPPSQFFLIPLRQQALLFVFVSVITFCGLLFFYSTQFFEYSPLRYPFSSTSDDHTPLSKPSSSLNGTVDYTDPLNITRNLFYGPLLCSDIGC